MLARLKKVLPRAHTRLSLFVDRQLLLHKKSTRLHYSSSRLYEERSNNHSISHVTKTPFREGHDRAQTNREKKAGTVWKDREQSSRTITRIIFNPYVKFWWRLQEVLRYNTWARHTPDQCPRSSQKGTLHVPVIARHPHVPVIAAMEIFETLVEIMLYEVNTNTFYSLVGLLAHYAWNQFARPSPNCDSHNKQVS